MVSDYPNLLDDLGEDVAHDLGILEADDEEWITFTSVDDLKAKIEASEAAD